MSKESPGFIRRCWRTLSTPSARYSMLGLLVVGFAGGIIFWGGFNTGLEATNTLGFGLSDKAGKLILTGNVIATRARWDNNVSGGNWANNPLNGLGAAPTTIAAMFISATPLPTTTSDTVELRLNGKYTIGKGQALRVSYAYLHMRSADSMYEGMQLGSLSTQLPTSEQPFSFNVHTIAVAYIYSFR